MIKKTINFNSVHRLSFKEMMNIFVYLFLSLILISCGDDSSSSANKSAQFGKGGKKPAKQVPVEALNPQIGLAASFYVTTSTIVANSDANINSRTVGVVKEILREEGDDVLAGEVLLVLDDQEQKLRLKQAQQKLASTRREYERLNKMRKAGVVSSTEWETTQNNFRLAETEEKLAELALSYTQVAAPFDGRVVWREVDLGTHVSQGELLFRMMSINPLLVRVHIPANRLGMVKVGQKVSLSVDSSPTPLEATISLVSPIVDPTSGTIKITLSITEYPSSVRPGDFTEIRMVTDQHPDALLVPSVAIIEERGQHFVYLVKDNIANKVAVSIGFIMSEQTEIVSGVKKTDLVVIKGQRTLNDDVPVKILNLENQSLTNHEKQRDIPENKSSEAKKAKLEKANNNKRGEK